MTKEYAEWKEAKKDLNKKVRELLKDIHRQNIEYFKNAILRGNLIEDHMKNDQNFSVPKDFIIALAKKQEWNYRNNFGTRKGKTSSNRRVGKYLRDMGI